MDSLIPLYIWTIQIALFLLTVMVWACDCTPLFADTLKSAIIRGSISFSLLIVGYYASFLILAPHILVFAILVISLASSYYIGKYLYQEYNKRKQERWAEEYFKDKKGLL
jgi:membrane protein implicated in regulation of membrane protease activity